MKNLKKVLALVLVLAMSLSVVAFAGTTFPDVADTASYAEAAKVLKSLNIMVGDEQGNFNPDKTVTRAEMAKLLCAITGSADLAPAYCGFPDVAADHWASGYIAVARNNGWIDGYEDGTFRPNDIVLYEQAIKLVMSALNYGIYAEEQGGYPYGWLMAAGEAEVTRAGATGAVGEECSRAKIAMIIYYALEANMMKQTAFGDKKWEIIEGQTLLTKYLDTYKVEGKVANTYKHDTNLDEGFVTYDMTKIAGMSISQAKAQTIATDTLGATAQVVSGATVSYRILEIDAAGTDAADLLAYSTVAYINVNEDGELALVAIAAKGNKNKTVEIADMEKVYDDSKDSAERATRKPELVDSANYRFSYWAGDRDTDAAITPLKLDPSVVVVVNSTAPQAITNFGTDDDTSGDVDTVERLADLVPANGTIKLTDTDSDGYYDLIEITSYDVAVVDYANADKEKIILKDRTAGVPGSISFDKEVLTHLTDVSITLDGKAIELADLQENDILTISTNSYSDPTYYNIVVTRKTVEGKVTAMKASDGIAYIGGEGYKVVPGLVTYGTGADVDMNVEGVFYLDAQGKIAYVDDQTVASDDYAIVDKFAVNSMDEVSIRMLTYEGVVMTALVAEEVKINGTKVVLDSAVADQAALDAIDLNAVTWSSGMTYYDAVKAVFDGTYDVVGAGVTELNKIITFGIAKDEVNEINFAVGSGAGEFGYVTNASGAEWQADNNRFKSSKTLADNAVVVCMETGRPFADYKFTTAETLVDANAYSPYFLSLQKDGTIGLAVLTTLPSTLNQDASLAIFADYRTGVYGEDEVDVAYVTYIVDGAVAEEALPVDLTAFANISAVGDVFLFAKNGDGIVDQVEIVFAPSTGTMADVYDTGVDGDAKDLDEFMEWNTADEEDNEIFFGTLIKAASGKLTVAPYQNTTTTISGSTVEIVNVPDTAKVYAYKGYNTDAKKLAICDTIVDLDASSVRNSTGDYTVDAVTDLAYVFFRINNGTVVEVIGVDYYKD